MSEPRRIEVRFPSRRAVLASSRAEGPDFSLFAPTSETAAIGERVTLLCFLGDGDQPFELTGRVVFQRTESVVGKDRGLGVQFSEPTEKRAAAEMLTFCAGRRVDQGLSGTPRIATALRCTVRLQGAKFRAEVKDLSAGGAFVTSAPLSAAKAGTQLLLQLGPRLFGLGGVTLAARLVWTGQKNGQSGFGARFTGDPSMVRPALKRFLEQSAVAGKPVSSRR